MPTRKVLKGIDKKNGEKTPEVKFLLYDDGLTAQGKERQQFQSSSSPKGKLDPKNMSRQAALLEGWRNGSSSCQARLLKDVSEQVIKHAKIEQWPLPIKKARDLVYISGFFHAHGFSDTDEESAKDMGVSVARYKNVYKPMVKSIREIWFDKYAKELFASKNQG